MGIGNSKYSNINIKQYHDISLLTQTERDHLIKHAQSAQVQCYNILYLCSVVLLICIAQIIDT